MTQEIIDTGTFPDDGTGDSLRTAFTKVNENFDQIWATGLPNGNVAIANTQISANILNANLILAGNGIGTIQTKSPLVPAIGGVYDLGTDAQRYRTVYIGVGGINTQGPLVLNGGINVSGNINSSGNISAQYFIGNGSQLTGIDATSIRNGTSSVGIPTANGNVVISVAGINPIAEFSSNLFSVNTDAEIAGNLTVSGNIVYVNIENLNVEDPIIGLGRGPNNTPLTSNDGLDRGTQLWYYDGNEKSAFFGYDNSTGNIFAAVDVTVVDEVATVNEYGNFVVGNLVAETIISSGNVTATNFIGNVVGNISGNVVAPGVNTQVSFNDNGQLAGDSGFTYDKTTETVTVANTVTASNVVATTFYGDGGNLGNVLADRGAAPMNWNTTTQIGVYTVNNTSWSGTTGAPLDSSVYVGLLEVKNSTNTAITQSFWPGIVTDPNNVKLMWVRNYWNGSWTAWQKIINSQQIVDGGSQF